MLQKKSPIFWKWILSVFLIIILIMTGIAVYLNYYWKPILSARIKEAIYTSTDGLYRINFDNIRVNVITGNLSVTNIEFTPDTLIYEKMRADSIAPRHIYKVAVAMLVLKRIRPWKIYFNRILEIKSVLIDKPVLQISFNKNTNITDSLKEDNRTAWQRLSPYLKSIKIGDIAFRNANFQYIDHSSPKGKVTGLQRLNIKITDLLIDSVSQYDRSRLYSTKDIYAEFHSYKAITADSNYTIQVQEFQASTAKRYARLKGLRLIPGSGEMEFSKLFKYQKDRYSASIEEVQLNNIDYMLLNRDRRLLASALVLEKGNLSIFLNRAMPDSIRDKGLNFPQRALRRFQLDTSIDTVLLRDSRLSYSEYNPDSRRKGTVTFSKINGRILNLTNDSLSLIKNRFADLKLTALLMDRGRFNVAMKLDLESPGAAFEFKGNVGNMDAGMFNAAIRPLSLILIRTGFLERMIFEGTGSIKGVIGSLTCYYNDLKITLLERSEETNWLKRRGIASIFANMLIIRGENPSPGQPVRKANFRYIRPQHSSFFNMIWKGLAEALLETIGFDSATQKEIHTRLRKMEIERFDREERRDDRLKKRDVRRSNRNDNR